VDGITVDEEYTARVESAQEVEHSLIGWTQGKQVCLFCVLLCAFHCVIKDMQMRELRLVEQNIVPVSAFIASGDVFTTVGNNFASIGLSG